MYEITYLVFIRYRGPFGLSVPLPRLRTAHINHPLRVFQQFNLVEELESEQSLPSESEDWLATVPEYLRYPTSIHYCFDQG